MIIWLSEDMELSNNRVNRLLSVIRSLFNYLEDDEEYNCRNNISNKIKNLPSETVREIVFLDNDIIIKLYNYFINTEQYKFATLLALAYESGGRKSELAQVTKYCIINKEYNTNIVVGKRGKRFPLIYFDLTQKAGELWLEQRGEDNKPELFNANSNNIYNWVVSWRNIVKDLTGNYYKFNVHSFRHSCLQNLINGTHEVYNMRGVKTVGLEELRKIAHHESAVITTSYLKKNDDIESLKEVFTKTDEIDDTIKDYELEEDINNKNLIQIKRQDETGIRPYVRFGLIDRRRKIEYKILNDEDDFIF